MLDHGHNFMHCWMREYAAAIANWGKPVVVRLVNRHGRGTANRLYYFFWRHHFAVQTASTVSTIRAGLADKASDLVIMRLDFITQLLTGLKTRTLNTKTKTPAGKRLGYGTNGYGMGWSIPYRRLMDMCEAKGRLQGVRPHGHLIRPLTVHLLPAYAVDFLEPRYA